MKNFEFYTPTKIIFGKNTENQIGTLISQFKCKKVLIHYGTNSIKKTGLLDKIKKILNENKINYVELK